jgi:hypothetical protein
MVAEKNAELIQIKILTSSAVQNSTLYKILSRPYDAV